MKTEYDDLPHSIQILLENNCSKEPMVMNPRIFYSAVVGLLKKNPPIIVARQFDISISLVEMIEEKNL